MKLSSKLFALANILKKATIPKKFLSEEYKMPVTFYFLRALEDNEELGVKRGELFISIDTNPGIKAEVISPILRTGDKVTIIKENYPFEQYYIQSIAGGPKVKANENFIDYLILSSNPIPDFMLTQEELHKQKLNGFRLLVETGQIDPPDLEWKYGLSEEDIAYVLKPLKD